MTLDITATFLSGLYHHKLLKRRNIVFSRDSFGNIMAADGLFSKLFLSEYVSCDQTDAQEPNDSDKCP